MTRPLSLLLDVIRFAAALLVFFHHAATGKFGSGLPYRLKPRAGHPVLRASDAIRPMIELGLDAAEKVVPA